MDGKIALVTGAGRGIGKAIALQLARDGYDIWANYHSNHEAAQLLKTEIEALGRNCLLVACDITDSGRVEEIFSPLLEQAVPEILVNNAGITRDGLLVWMSDKDWTDVVDTSLNGFFNITRRVAFKMLRERRGVIISISSTAGQSGHAGQCNYSAAKAGIIGASKSLAMELAGRGIRVNVVAPGFIATEMTEKLPLNEIIPRIPMKRIGLPEDVAAAVSFLCSSGANYITGQVLAVNGGIYV